MRPLPFSLLLLASAALALAGCDPNLGSRYYLEIENSPDGTVTRLFDSKHNTQVIYIYEPNQEPPSVTVLPDSRLDVSSVSVDSMGQEEVLIGYTEEEEGNTHSVLVTGSDQPMRTVLGHVDTDKDGKTDLRTLRFQTDSGFIQYFDFDANGVLDAQYSGALEGASAHEARILAGQCWVAVEGDSALFHDPALTATSKEAPRMTYQFRDGAWHNVEAPTTPR